MVPDGIHFLYKHLIDGHQIVQIENYDKDLLDIMPWNVLESIEKGEDSWEIAVPKEVSQIIKEKNLFNYASKNTNIA